MNEVKNRLQEKLILHFSDAVEQCSTEENLKDKLLKLSKILSSPTDSRLKPICEYVLSNWADRELAAVDSSIKFEEEMKLGNILEERLFEKYATIIFLSLKFCKKCRGFLVNVSRFFTIPKFFFEILNVIRLLSRKSKLKIGKF